MDSSTYIDRNTALLAILALTFSLGCGEGDPCGCGLYRGSPHDYTEHRPGSSQVSASGSATIARPAGPQTFALEGRGETWRWTGGRHVSLHAPHETERDGGEEYVALDGGGREDDLERSDANTKDAGVETDGGLDLDASAPESEAPDAVAAVTKPSLVGIVDLGETPLGETGALTGATLVYCDDRQALLVIGVPGGPDAGLDSTRATGWVCEGEEQHPARTEPVEGTLDVRSTRSGDITHSSSRLTDRTAGGSQLDLFFGTRSEAPRSFRGVTCY